MQCTDCLKSPSRKCQYLLPVLNTRPLFNLSTFLIRFVSQLTFYSLKWKIINELEASSSYNYQSLFDFIVLLYSLRTENVQTLSGTEHRSNEDSNNRNQPNITVSTHICYVSEFSHKP